MFSDVNDFQSWFDFYPLYAAETGGKQLVEDGNDLAAIDAACTKAAAETGRPSLIRVRSIIGQFLEHSRIYYFLNDGDDRVFLSSADWMDRNFFRRIEVCFPIERKQHRDRIVEDLQTYLADNEQAWVLKPDGNYERATANGAPPVIAQRGLLQRYSDCND